MMAAIVHSYHTLPDGPSQESNVPHVQFEARRPSVLLLLQTWRKCNWSLPVVMDEHATSDGWIKEGPTHLQLHRFVSTYPCSDSPPFPSLPHPWFQLFFLFPHPLLPTPHFTFRTFSPFTLTLCAQTAVGGAAAEILLDPQYGQRGLHAHQNKTSREILKPSYDVRILLERQIHL